MEFPTPPGEPRSYTGFAVVTKRGVPLVDTICATKKDTEHYLTQEAREKGCSIRRVHVVLQK